MQPRRARNTTAGKATQATEKTTKGHISWESHSEICQKATKLSPKATEQKETGHNGIQLGRMGLRKTKRDRVQQLGEPLRDLTECNQAQRLYQEEFQLTTYFTAYLDTPISPYLSDPPN